MAHSSSLTMQTQSLAVYLEVGNNVILNTSDPPQIPKEINPKRKVSLKKMKIDSHSGH